MSSALTSPSGWQVCYQRISPLQWGYYTAVRCSAAACDGEYLMLAGGPRLARISRCLPPPARRRDLRGRHAWPVPATTRNDNGSEWYFGPATRGGSLPPASPWSAIQLASAVRTAPARDQRMCWHTRDGYFQRRRPVGTTWFMGPTGHRSRAVLTLRPARARVRNPLTFPTQPLSTVSAKQTGHVHRVRRRPAPPPPSARSASSQSPALTRTSSTSSTTTARPWRPTRQRRPARPACDSCRRAAARAAPR